jgi:hypothetical protein
MPMQPRTLTPQPARLIRWLIVVGVAAQIISAPLLWSHRSVGGTLFNAYTPRYGLALAAHAVLSLFWIALLIQRHTSEGALWRIPQRFRIAGVVGFTLTGALAPLFPIEADVRSYAAATCLLLALLLIATWTAPLRLNRRWIWIGAGITIVIVIATALSTLTRFPFSPDEAHWADYASTAWNGTPPGIYARTWLMPPQVIVPGIGWSVAAYGWFLEYVWFDIRMGRIWNLAFNLAAILSAGALAWRLYGRRTGALTLIFAAFSTGVIAVFDYRPDHQLAFAGGLIALCAAQARRTRRAVLLWHGAVGLLAALSLQLHAAGIAFAFGVSVFYLIESAFSLFKRRTSSARVLIAYVAGALVGTLIYYVFNILPAGGLDAYLASLTAERSVRLTWFAFLTWDSFAEWTLFALALIFLLFRRSDADRFLLLLIACIWIGLALFDTQGYRAPTVVLLMCAVGAALAEGFGFVQQRRWVIAAALAVTAGGAAAFIDGRGLDTWVRTGTPPTYVYRDLRAPLQAHIRDDDVIAGSHLLIWTLPDHPQLVSYAGEVTGMRRWSLTDSQAVWERVAPTIVINIEPEMTINPGLSQYMEQRQFVLCASFSLRQLNVTLYRPGCLSDNGA